MRRAQHKISRAMRVWTKGEAVLAMGLPRGDVLLEDYRVAERVLPSLRVYGLKRARVRRAEEEDVQGWAAYCCLPSQVCAWASWVTQEGKKGRERLACDWVEGAWAALE